MVSKNEIIQTEHVLSKIVDEMSIDWSVFSKKNTQFMSYTVEGIQIYIPSTFQLSNKVESDFLLSSEHPEMHSFIEHCSSCKIQFQVLQTRIDEVQFEAFVNGVISIIRKSRPSMKILSEKLIDGVENPYSYMDCFISTLDGEAYLFLGVLLIDNQVAFLTFYGPKVEREFWLPICVGVLANITVDPTMEAALQADV